MEEQHHRTHVIKLRPNNKEIYIKLIILEKFQMTQTKDGNNLWKSLVADETGCIEASFFDTTGEVVQPGDIILLCNGYSSMYKGALSLYVGKQGHVRKLGFFTMAYIEVPNMSLLRWSKVNRGFVPLPPGNNVDLKASVREQYEKLFPKPEVSDNDDRLTPKNVNTEENGWLSSEKSPMKPRHTHVDLDAAPP